MLALRVRHSRKVKSRHWPLRGGQSFLPVGIYAIQDFVCPTRV